MTLALFSEAVLPLATPPPRSAPPAKERLDHPPENPEEAVPPEALVKWVGGKRDLVRRRPDAFRAPQDVPRVHIPFVGGGALFFMRYPGRPARLSDINPRLVNAYQATKDDAGKVADHVASLVSGYERARPQGMEALRQVFELERERLDEGDSFLRAARFLFVVGWGFNGLYRENGSGGCNTPHGDGTYRLFDRARLLACGRALANAEILCVDFEEALSTATAKDFAYLDCPYAPVSATASFTSYTGGGSWGAAAGQGSLRGLEKKTDRQRLVETIACLDRRNVDWTLSDADTPETEQLYRGWIVETVQMRRAINRDAKKRGPVSELLVRNWP